MNWQPIETAPKLRNVMVWDRDAGLVFARLTDSWGDDRWMSEHDVRLHDVIAWQPRPEPPHV